MNLLDIVSVHTTGGRQVFALPDALALVGRLAEARALPDDAPEDAVVIDRATTGDEGGAVERLAGIIGDRAVGVLLLDAALTTLPVGWVLRVLGEHRLRALSLHSMTGSGVGSVLVVTRDAGLPLRSHVLGETYATSEPHAGLRRDNELIVEGVVARAHVAALDARLRAVAGTEQALTGDLERLRAELAAEHQAALDARAEVRRLERALTVVERRSPGYRAVRLASRVGRDAAGTGRAVLGRLGRRSS